MLYLVQAGNTHTLHEAADRQELIGRLMDGHEPLLVVQWRRPSWWRRMLGGGVYSIDIKMDGVRVQHIIVS